MNSYLPPEVRPDVLMAPRPARKRRSEYRNELRQEQEAKARTKQDFFDAYEEWEDAGFPGALTVEKLVKEKLRIERRRLVSTIARAIRANPYTKVPDNAHVIERNEPRNLLIFSTACHGVGIATKSLSYIRKRGLQGRANGRSGILTDQGTLLITGRSTPCFDRGCLQFTEAKPKEIGIDKLDWDMQISKSSGQGEFFNGFGVLKKAIELAMVGLPGEPGSVPILHARDTGEPLEPTPEWTLRYLEAGVSIDVLPVNETQEQAFYRVNPSHIFFRAFD